MFNKYFNIKDEKPLDNIVSDGGYTAIFRTICCIGDSLASGEMESRSPEGNNGYHDMFEYSWGQFIARTCNSTVYNFSRGGMSAREFCESFAENSGFWNNRYASQAYIIALGVNDIYGEHQEIGSINDIDFSDYRNNTKNYAGYMGQIIQRMKEIQPRARFFLMTLPNDVHLDSELIKQQRKLMYEFSEKFDNTYVLDIYKYAPIYNDELKEKLYLYGHMSPIGYLFTAKMIMSYIDYIIRHNTDDFKDIALIGTGLH